MPEGNAVIATDEEFIYEKTWRDANVIAIARRFIKNKIAIAGMVIILIVVFGAVFAPLLTRYDYKTVDPINAFAAPSLEHLFGTDQLGRDLFSRILHGGRYSLSVSLLAESLSMFFIVILGAVAGYFGGAAENLIMRACDVIQSIPNLLLCIVVSQALGSGVIPTTIALSIGGTPNGIRLLRASILSIREQEFVEAAKAINCSRMRIMFRHIVPNCLAPLIVNYTIGLGIKIMISASLSFLGLGIQEPLPEWGAMISAGKSYFRYNPQLVLFPGLVIAIVVLAYNLMGNGLRDALDPKLKT